MRKSIYTMVLALTILIQHFTPIYSFLTLNTAVDGVFGVNVTTDGLPTDWLIIPKLHPSINVDGFINDWYTEYYWFPRDVILRTNGTDIKRGLFVFEEGGGNKYLYYRGEFVWFDAINDTLINRVEADLVEARVSGNSSHLLMLIRVKELKSIGSEANESLLLSILLDTDMNWSNGRVETIDQYTNVSIYAPWDYQVILNLANPNVSNLKPMYGGGGFNALRILNSSFTDVASNKSYFVVNKALGIVEIAIHWVDIGVNNAWNVSNVRIYLLSFIGDTSGNVVKVNPNGSNVIDCISKLTTVNETSDGVIDYWVDIGFTINYEPVFYSHIVADEIGLTQVWMDLSNDYRVDYIVDEAFDVDLLLFALSMDPINDKLYGLIHIKGDVRPRLNVSPAIAIVIDTTPFNATDGYASIIDPPTELHPYGTFKTETELGCPTGLPGDVIFAERSCKWDRLIWITSWVQGVNEVFEVAVFNGTLFTRYSSVKASLHFIEFEVPLSIVDPELYRKNFRLEIAVFAQNLRGKGLFNATGSNVYDVLAPYPTWGQGIEVINAYPYAKLGEVYDEDGDVWNDLKTNNGDHWLDSFHLKKNKVVIEKISVYHIDYDNDGLIELGEYLWVKASMRFFNGTSWLNASDKVIKVYFVSKDFRVSYYLGSNSTDEEGVFYLYLGEAASYIPSGSYYLMLLYEPIGVDTLLYSGVELLDTSRAYIVLNRPFTPIVSEPKLLALTLLLILLITLLLKRYLHNRF